ncbi:HEC/Ndc80p family-domain-containing protein [Suillus clintonianus]|uniref:HEC/Ndc80p family-domain-containing protein n=1 Tax=Suillus clintonianus TaxID=1904413 RepID=UPI001B86F685|nr:HEC/Ndc80p family-domain-containing protein [Suillus clintonianus]KAG2112844.1 HEC/Ndc80p family-domain-containing protein [Suillus clintonianus]
MSEALRRSTMQPATDIYGNARSGLPMPSTAKKASSSAMRMSLAGPAARTPYLPSGAGSGSNTGHSGYRSQTANPLLQSTSKPNYGRTPLTNSSRRGSVWTGGASIAPPSGSQTFKDPRPIRDRPYQSKMKQEICSWLQATEFDISMQAFSNITGKDYRAMFQHLVAIVDQGYPFDPRLRFEDEFQPALKALRYPFAAQIDNKWLAAPASPHSWPALLAALHWLVEMGKARLNYLESEDDPTLQIVDRIPEEFSDPIHHQALAFEYFSEAYVAFFHGADVFHEQDKALEASYAKKNERVVGDLEGKKALLAQGLKELDELQSSKAPLEKLQKIRACILDDRAKFDDVLHRLESRKRQLTESVVREKAELAARSQNLDQLKAEHEKLTEVVKVQNLTPEEVIRMNTDHETLARNLEDLKYKISEAHKTVMSLEVITTNRGAAAEEALDLYGNLLSALGLFPPLPPPFDNIDLRLELNTATANPQQLLLGSDIRKVIKPTLSSVAEIKRTERADIESERIKVDNELDHLTLDCENVDEEVREIEKKVMSLNEQADDLRDAAQQESMVSNAEAARLERELAHARTAALSSGMGVKSRLQALQFDYREQIAKVSRLKDETIRAIAKNSNEIGLFKEEVSAQLRRLRDFVEEGN